MKFSTLFKLVLGILCLKVSKFQNEFVVIVSSNIWTINCRISALQYKGQKFWQFFVHIFWGNDDFINSFWNLLSFSSRPNLQEEECTKFLWPNQKSWTLQTIQYLLMLVMWINQLGTIQILRLYLCTDT